MKEAERAEQEKELIALGGREGDIQRIKDLAVAIEGEEWEKAEALLWARRGEVVEAFSRLMKERDTLLEAWRSRLHGLPQRDSIPLLLEMQRMTRGGLKDGLRILYLQSFFRFLTPSIGILVKLVIALIFAAAAAIVHHFIAARIERAFDSWLRQYLALVAFIFIYGLTEKRLERIFDRVIIAIRRWGLYAEAQRAYLDEVTLRNMEAALARLRVDITVPPDQETR